MPEARCRVLLADDHAVVRDGLRLVLEQFGWVDVVDTVATAEHAVRAAVELHPDVVIMDVAMPECGGIEATRRIAVDAPLTRVLILTTHSDGATLRAAREAGASGFVAKAGALGDLAAALRAVWSGDRQVDLEGFVADEPAEPARPLAQLTDGEFDVLALLAIGLRNDEIAARLHLSAKTVANACTRVYQKLGVQSRTEAARTAHQAGVGL